MANIVRRFLAGVRVHVVVDLAKTLEARRKYPMFQQMIIGRFDQSIAMYRIFDRKELKFILDSGKITGGQYSVKAERDHGASWGSNINEVIHWGQGQRGGRLGEDLYLAKLDAMDKFFAHLDPQVEVDLDGPQEQPVSMDAGRCYTGIGCSIIDVGVEDVDFFIVDKDEQIQKVTVSDLKSELKGSEPEEVKRPAEDKVRDPAWNLQPKDKVLVLQGSKSLGVMIRSTAKVMDVWQRKGEREVMVKLFFAYPRRMPDGRLQRDDLTLYVTHENRLKDSQISLRNSKGDKILVKKR